MLARTALRKHVKGQDDHVDAWLMSYADLITLLFALFVIFVSASMSHQRHASTTSAEAHPLIEPRSGTLALSTPFDDIYHRLSGLVSANDADQFVAVEKTARGVWVDMSALQFFAPGTADIPAEQLPVIQKLAKALNDAPTQAPIEVEGYSDDEPLKNSAYANNWELCAIRASRIVALLTEAGIDPARLHIASYAGNHPLVANTDMFGNPIDNNRKRNQRVVIKLEQPLKSATGLE